MDQKDSWAPQHGYSRRHVLILGGGAALSAVVIAACGDDSGSATTTGGAGTTGGAATTGGAGTTAAGAAAGRERGHVRRGWWRRHREDRLHRPARPGPLAGFGEANDFILAQINDLVTDGIMLGDKSFTVEIITKDVESNSDTAAARAGELILDENVDMMIASRRPR